MKSEENHVHAAEHDVDSDIISRIQARVLLVSSRPDIEPESLKASSQSKITTKRIAVEPGRSLTLCAPKSNVADSKGAEDWEGDLAHRPDI